jgi:hypothetical protein
MQHIAVAHDASEHSGCRRPIGLSRGLPGDLVRLSWARQTARHRHDHLRSGLALRDRHRHQGSATTARVNARGLGGFCRCGCRARTVCTTCNREDGSTHPDDVADQRLRPVQSSRRYAAKTPPIRGGTRRRHVTKTSGSVDPGSRHVLRIDVRTCRVSAAKLFEARVGCERPRRARLARTGEAVQLVARTESIRPLACATRASTLTILRKPGSLCRRIGRSSWSLASSES